MASSAFNTEQYYAKIGSIQQSIHEGEKRRLALERELLAYSISDKGISKCAKLHSYLKEICERETQAKMRNHELLRDVECIETSMKEYEPDFGSLQQQKAKCLNRISSFMAARKKTERKLDIDKFEAAYIHQHDSHSQPTKDSQLPAEVFTGCPTSRGSATVAATTSVPSRKASHHSPNHLTLSHEHLPSGLLKDFRVCGEAAADNQAHLSDDISDSNDSPGSCYLSDKHKGTAAALPSVCALTGAAGGMSFGGDDEHVPSPSVTLMRPEKDAPSLGSISPMWAQNSPAEYAFSREAVHQMPKQKEVEKALSHSVPKTCLGKEWRDLPDRGECVGTPSDSVNLSQSSTSDLSISLTDSELEDEDLPEGVANLDPIPAARMAPEMSATAGGGDSDSLHREELFLHAGELKNRPPSNHDSIPPEAALERLSHQGLFHLLESIEGQLHGEQTNVYWKSSIDQRKLNTIVSLCNKGASLNDEDLEACGAAVLHELQRLSWSTAKGCLLPQDLVIAHRSSTQPKEISSSLPPDAAQLWDRWFKHALLLKEWRVLSTERLLQLFTPLLLERHATYSHQAKVLLRTLLSQSCEECPSAEDESDLSSSCGLPSLLADGGEMQPGRPAHNKGKQELQSTEEDSQDESPAESIPIRETKAYQLLKQSATQERLQSSGEEEEDGLSGINDGREEDPGRAKRSSHQDPYPRSEKATTRTFYAAQSKAFWGESDDSNSEIEAALRPQPYITNIDDFDDFCD
ncbi:centrosomal protein kizuna [Lampris incognitus]|uniref:centrosomal protein kizuna n=1 Tax=Lampris incognitus TaxID=2546036 RepID=UPI0024B485B9|nr:centrosomal protein kizuna [Lampris incognitus]